MTTFSFGTTSPSEQTADLLVLPAFQGPEAGPGGREAGKALDVDLTKLLKDNGFRGTLGETFTLPTLGRIGAGTVLVLGVGKRADVDADVVRRAIGRAASTVARYRRVATTLPRAVTGSLDATVQAFVEGLLLGSYRFDRYKVRPIDRTGRSPAWTR